MALTRPANTQEPSATDNSTPRFSLSAQPIPPAQTLQSSRCPTETRPQIKRARPSRSQRTGSCGVYIARPQTCQQELQISGSCRAAGERGLSAMMRAVQRERRVTVHMAKCQDDQKGSTAGTARKTAAAVTTPPSQRRRKRVFRASSTKTRKFGKPSENQQNQKISKIWIKPPEVEALGQGGIQKESPNNTH